MLTIDIWTIYWNTTDYPNRYVARKFIAEPDKVTATKEIITDKSLEELRSHFSAKKLQKMDRWVNDDRNIIETWF